MKRALLFAVLALAGTQLAGCYAHSAVVSSDKKAYIVSGNILSVNMYACSIEGGHPVCTQVTEGN